MTTSFEGITIADPRLDDKRFTFEGIDFEAMDPKLYPRFTVSEVGKVFFGRSSYWVRLQETEGNLELDGEQVGTGRTESGARSYTLADIEKMGHALANHGVINARQLNDVLLLAATCGRVWGFVG